MITWGLTGRGADRLAAVYCSYCRAVFARSVEPMKVNAESDKAAKLHHCTPTPPWRPTRR